MYALEYVGEVPLDDSVEAYAKLGEVTAALHRVEGYPHGTDFRIAAIVSKELPTIAAQLPFREAYIDVLRSLPSFAGLPECLTHGEITPQHAIGKANGDIVLIDWDEVGVGLRVFDIGFPLISQFISEVGEFFEDRARAFYGAYRQRIELTKAELQHVFAASLVHALFHIVHGDIEKRWRRIQWAIANKALVESVLR